MGRPHLSIGNFIINIIVAVERLPKFLEKVGATFNGEILLIVFTLFEDFVLNPTQTYVFFLENTN